MKEGRYRAFTLGLLLTTVLISSSAQQWNQSPAPTNDWWSVASSADGQIIYGAGNAIASVVQGPRPIYFSTNSGTDWTKANAPSNYWWSITCSANGRTALACAFSSLAVTTNRGVTWQTFSSVITNAYAAASSADGGLFVIAEQPGHIYISTNLGADWVRTSAPATNWSCVAVSADGRRIAAGVWGAVNGNAVSGPIFTSSDGGNTWRQTAAPLQLWEALGSSADGLRLVAGGLGTYLYTSGDGGVTWTSNTLTFNFGWQSAASSADGTRLIAVNNSPRNAAIFTSADSGATWQQHASPNSGFIAASASSDGTKFVVARLNAIWTLYVDAEPRLRIERLGIHHRLHWILPSTPLSLQQSDTLAPAWIQVTKPPRLNTNHLRYELEFQSTNAASFYRLAAP